MKKGRKVERYKGRKVERQKGRKEERKKGRKVERQKGRNVERQKDRKVERKKGRNVKDIIGSEVSQTILFYKEIPAEGSWRTCSFKTLDQHNNVLEYFKTGVKKSSKGKPNPSPS